MQQMVSSFTLPDPALELLVQYVQTRSDSLSFTGYEALRGESLTVVLTKVSLRSLFRAVQSDSLLLRGYYGYVLHDREICTKPGMTLECLSDPVSRSPIRSSYVTERV